MTKRVNSSILNFFKPQLKQPKVLTTDVSSPGPSSACTQFVSDSESQSHPEAELAAPQVDACSLFNPYSEGELSESDDDHVCSPSNPPPQSDAELSSSLSTDSNTSTFNESINR